MVQPFSTQRDKKAYLQEQSNKLSRDAAKVAATDNPAEAARLANASQRAAQAASSIDQQLDDAAK